MRPPLNVRVDARALPRAGHAETIRAGADERAALARANDLSDVTAFEADMLVAPWQADGVRVTGRVRGSIVQECVVSLEPLAATIDEPIEMLLVPEGSPLAPPTTGGEGEIVLSAEGDEPPETFVSPYVDIGAIAAEHFALAIDPYPRAEGAVLPAEASDAPANPFAALSALKAGS